MSVRRKISIRKIIQSVLTLVLVCAGVMAIVSATKVQEARSITKLSIHINNDEFGFVTKEDVQNILLNDKELSDVVLSTIDVAMMERMLSGNVWIEDAQVYIDNERTLYAEVTQRVPVLRVFDQSSNSYYLDKYAEPLPLSDKYNYYTAVVTNVPELTTDSIGKSVRMQIMAVADYIRHDSFWTAQVAHFIVNDDMSFEIVPVLGNQRIIIGDTSNLELKFNNLFTFYKNVLCKVGWDKYDVLDLSYNGQLVASPSLDWKLPKDNVINRINWVESIMGEYGRKVLEHNRKVQAEPIAKAEPEAQQEVEKAVLQLPDENILPQEGQEEQIIKPTQQPVKKRKAKKRKTQTKEEQTPKYIYNGSDDL